MEDIIYEKGRLYRKTNFSIPVLKNPNWIPLNPSEIIKIEIGDTIVALNELRHKDGITYIRAFHNNRIVYIYKISMVDEDFVLIG